MSKERFASLSVPAIERDLSEKLDLEEPVDKFSQVTLQNFDVL